jgi:hypothetical protein
MAEHERTFWDVVDRCARIRTDWEENVRIWHERPSDEVFERCTKLVHDLSTACEMMRTIIGHYQRVRAEAFVAA